MKSLGLCLVLCLATGTSAQPVPTHEVVASVIDAFVPAKGKSTAEVYVVISGIFPNTCYAYDRAQVSDAGVMTHEIRAYATVSETVCLMVLVPFTKEVSLGHLAPGEHRLLFISGDGTSFERKLQVDP